MVDVPVLTVEIDDSQFRAFQERVKEFRAEASEAPKEWAGTDEQIAVIQKRFEEMRKAAEDQKNAAKKVKDDGKSTIGSFSEIMVGFWKDLLQPSVGFTAKTIYGATRELAKWERLTATFSALVGAGGLYGLDTLAAAAAMRRQRAGGAGVTTGELASFQANFGRLGGTDALLEGFNRAATDPTARQPLNALGLQARGKDALQLFAEALPRVKALADRTDPKMLGPALAPYGLDQLGFDEQMLRTIRAMSPEEIRQLVGQARADDKTFDIPDDVGRKWQDLENQLTRAGNQIKTSLAGSLVNITPGLVRLSESFVHLADVLLARPELKTFLDRVARGVGALGDELGSGAAQDGLRKVLDRMKMARADFDALDKWVGDHGTAIERVFAAVVGARVGGILGPVGAALGALIGGSGWAPTHMEGDHAADAKQRAGGATAERPTLEQRNAERRGLGVKPYASQREYDAAEPPARGPTVAPLTLPGAGGAGLREKVHAQDAPNAPGSITPENHPVRYEGTMRIDDQKFDFASGGNHGRWSSPPGDQLIESFTPPGVDPRTPFNAGYFRIAPKYDPELGRDREGVLIHESSHGQNVHDVVSSGCFAVPRSEWPQLEATLRAKLAALGGHAVLRVGSDGNAEVVPVGTPKNYSPISATRPSLQLPKERDLAKPAAITTPRPGSGLGPSGATHPNDRPKTPPAVVVHDNTGGSAQVVVAH